MKLLPIIILSIFMVGEIHAQKLYGFKQRVVPGTRQAVMDKNGNLTTEKRNELWKHMIYLEIPEGKNIQVTEIWLNGERYAFDTASVKSPVLQETGMTVPGQQEKLLIRETNNKILLITPRDKVDITNTNKRKITARKKIVVYYIRNGKTCYRSSNKIQDLPEMVMQ